MRPDLSSFTATFTGRSLAGEKCTKQLEPLEGVAPLRATFMDFGRTSENLTRLAREAILREANETQATELRVP